MHAGFSFSYSPISILLRQPLSIKKSYAGAIQIYLIPSPPQRKVGMPLANFLSFKKDR
jgi:hypothetical protein